jgi:hypothetical protein
MHKTYILANSVAWAAAIVASALLGAPSTLTLVLLPSLAAISLLAAVPRTSDIACRRPQA